MSRARQPSPFRLERDDPDRAVIDIGSNTVRLVVYAGSRRVPDAWFNEKVSARLGRDLSETGRIPDKAAEPAIAALRRYAALLRNLGVAEVEAVATAAVREAENGPEFLERVRALGLDPRVLTGEEEARASAHGVIGAFPDAHGVVADLGGGSLELISVEDGGSHHGVSLPLGTLRLARLRALGSQAFKREVHRTFDKAGWAAAHPGPMYMVGGTWRAFATYAMRSSLHPLSDPHAFALDVAEADAIAKKLARSEPRILVETAGLSSMRANALPDAAAMLRAMLAELRPDHLVFSSWGLREGLLYQRLGQDVREQDPLIEGVAHFVTPRGSSPSLAATIATWTAGAARQSGSDERLRLAATMLALATVRTEPNLRVRMALDWALHKRWIGIDNPGRAQLAAALLATCGKPLVPDYLRRLADEPALREAAAWGLAIRLCLRIGAGAPPSLLTSSLRLDKGELVLWLGESVKDLHASNVTDDLAVLAEWLGVAPVTRLGGARPEEPIRDKSVTAA